MNTITSTFLTMLLLLTTSIPLLSQDSSAVKNFTILKINGEITYKKETIGEVLVELFQQNKMVDAMETKSNGKFKFELENNHLYTIQISKEGYFTKRIEVNTNIPGDFKGKTEYPFDMKMTKYSEDIAKNIEHETLLEYPIAIISFHEGKEEFNFDKEYTKQIETELEFEASKD